jgi:hypothetical protein
VCCETAASSNENSGYIDQILRYSSQIAGCKGGNAKHSSLTVGTAAKLGVQLQICGTQYPYRGNSN